MSTRITSPTVTSGNSGAVNGGLSGAAQGAAAGAVIGGPVGAVVGGVIGGIAGALGGGSMDKAEKYRKLAAQWDTKGREREQAIAVRNQLREFRINRAMAMVAIASEDGGTRSSAPQGAVGGLGAQYAFNKNYTEGQIYIQRQVSKYSRKSAKAQSNAMQTFALMDTASSLATTAFGAYQGWKGAQDAKLATSMSRTGYDPVSAPTTVGSPNMGYSYTPNFSPPPR